MRTTQKKNKGYEIDYTQPLYSCYNYRKVVWLTGFVKTALSGALISTGVVLIFNCLTEHPLFTTIHEIGLILGIISITLAIILIYIIDRWHEHQKKEEYRAIDRCINAKAEKIAIEKVEEALDKISQK